MAKPLLDWVIFALVIATFLLIACREVLTPIVAT